MRARPFLSALQAGRRQDSRVLNDQFCRKRRGEVADKSGAPEKDPAIERLDLTDSVRSAAYQLKKAHPSVVFTSGRRSKEDQARAMATNVVLDRKFIEKTYKFSGLRTSCQQWVDSHPEKTTQAEIAQGLL